jgi:hypothetical protein
MRLFQSAMPERKIEYIRLKKRKDLTELAGSIKFYKNYDYKKLRKLRG